MTGIVATARARVVSGVEDFKANAPSRAVAVVAAYAAVEGVRRIAEAVLPAAAVVSLKGIGYAYMALSSMQDTLDDYVPGWAAALVVGGAAIAVGAELFHLSDRLFPADVKKHDD